MSSATLENHSEKKAFLVKSSSLKEVRTFCRDVFEKLKIEQSLKDELVLAIAEAAQNIVKHAYKDNQEIDSGDFDISVGEQAPGFGLFIALISIGIIAILRNRRL